MTDNEEIKIVKYITGKPGFVPVYTDVLDVSGAKMCGEEKMLYILLLRFYNKEKGYSYPSYATLAERTNWGKNKVIKYISSLEAKGFIKKDTDIYRREQNNQYIIYDIEIVMKVDGKKKFYYEAIMIHLKNAEDPKDFFESKYASIRHFIEKINQQKTVNVKGKLMPTEEFFERIGQVKAEDLFAVYRRVIDKDATGKIENRVNYLITALYESATTESAFNNG